MPWLNKRWISFFISSAAVAIVLVCVVGWANNQEGIKVRNQADAYGTLPTDTNQVLGVDVKVNYFDPNGKTGPTVVVQLSYWPIINNTFPAIFPFPIQIIVQQQTFNFTASATLPDHSFSLNAPGNPNTYPFDLYDGFIDIQASILPNNDDLPLTVVTEGALQGFTYSSHFQGNGSEVSIDFYVRRSTTTRVFAAIIFLLMWFLSLSIFIAAMSVWFRGKNAELPMVSISTALLFALPNIRNSQPGVPSPVGTTEDMVGFFWNILLVAASAIFLLVKWVLQNKRPPLKPTAVLTDPEGALGRNGK